MKQLKHLRQTLWRAMLCLTVAITCWGSVSAANFNKDATLYFKISNSNWKESSAWFAANFNNGATTSNDAERVKLTQVEGDYYSCTVPKDFSHVELLRMDPSNDINSSAWDYTNNFSQAPNGNNCLELASTGWSKINLTWTTYNNGGSGEVDPPVTGDSPYNYYLYLRDNEWIPFEFADGKYSLTHSVKDRNFCIIAIDKNKVPNQDNKNDQKPYTQNITVSEGSKDYDLNYNNTGDLNNSAFWGGNAESCTFVLTLDDKNLPKSVNITVGSGDTSEYEYYFRRTLQWNQPEKLTFTNGVAYFTRDMNANGKLCIEVRKKGETTSIENGWYAAEKGKAAVLSGEHRYTLTNSDYEYLQLPSMGGKYIFVITLDENKLPKDITITAPEIPETLPDLYIAGSWMSGQDEDLTKKSEMIAFRTGRYNEYAVKTSKAKEFFRFYTKSVADGLGTSMGSNGNNYTFTDGELNGSTEFTTVSSDNSFVFPKAGTYRIRVTGYDKNAAVKFTVSYTAPNEHLYLGANFKGNTEDPNFQLDNGTKFNKVRFTKYINDGEIMFRFAKSYNSENWIGPVEDKPIKLSGSNVSGTFDTSGKNSYQVYKVTNPGVYELEVLSWNNFDVKFKLTFIEEVDKETPYYSS